MSEGRRSSFDHLRVVYLYFLTIYICTLLGVALPMPGSRSAYTAQSCLTRAQKQRLARDWWYSTSHSKAAMKFVEVPSAIAPSVKKMAVAKQLHRDRDASAGTCSAFARDASFAAVARGTIGRETLREDLRVYRAANVAKHSDKFEQWCDSKRAVPSRPPWG